MTKEQINHLKTTLVRGGYNKLDDLWKRAFTEYALDTSKTLGMGCMACYRKVFNHLNQKYTS